MSEATSETPEATVAPAVAMQSALLDDVPKSVREHIDRETWKLPLEITAEASRNPTIAAVVHDADRRTRDQALEPMERLLRRAHLRVEIDMHQTETLFIALGPFVIVQKRPVKEALHICPRVTTIVVMVL